MKTRMAYKRKRSVSRGRSKTRTPKRGRSMSRKRTRVTVRSLARRMNATIETKESQWKTPANVGVEHNQVELLSKQDGGPLNPLQIDYGSGDPMERNTGQRIGDQVTLKGIKVAGFFEGALNRSKVHFRLMLIKMAKGDTVTRATLFQNKADNKMIDMINTERFTVVWQKKFTVTPPNATAQSVDAAGQTADARIGITGNTMINTWIPGRKIARGGIIKYENGNNAQVKFFDYRFYIMAYDWYGTPQDVNTVGRINEFYSCAYFQDA